jgi:hypothetical protein
MATILKIKRSSTNPTATPAALGQGELAYGEGTSTYTDAQGANVVSYGKLFVGRGTETNGISANIDIIGGKYFTDLLDHAHGVLTANSGVIIDSAKKIDQWNVDNITLDGNTISTTNSNGDLTFDTNGTGDVIIAGAATSGTNLFSINDGSTTRFEVDSYSGATTISSGSLSASEELLKITSTWNNSGSDFYGIYVDVTNTASSTDSRLINLLVGGSSKFAVDVNGNVYINGDISTVGDTSFNLEDDTAGAFTLKEGANKYFNIDTVDDAEKVEIGNNLSSVDIIVEDDTTNAFRVREGSNQYIAIDTTNGSELLTISTANVDIDRDLNVDGGDITTSATTFNLLNGSATTVNAFGDATAINIGSSSGTTNIKHNLDVDLDLNVDGGDITTSATTFNLLNSTATTVNAFGDATSVNIGAVTGTTNVKNDLDVDGDVNIDGGDLTVSTSTFNIADTVATTVNAFGAATALNLGANTGTATLRNPTLVGTATTQNVYNTVATTVNAFGDATALNLGASTGTTIIGNPTVRGSQTEQNLYDTVATTMNFAGAAATLNIGANNGTTTLRSSTLVGTATTQNVYDTVATTVNAFGAATALNLGADTGTLTIGNPTVVGTQTTQNLWNTVATTVNAFGAATNINIGASETLVDFGSLNIKGTTISSEAGAQTITIDPYPAGGDAGGDVVVRGNLQVTGTTITVNSTTMTVNDPVFTIGDSISLKVVTAAAVNGADTLTLDNTTGLNVGDLLSGVAEIPAGTTIVTIDSATQITISNAITGGIPSGTDVTFTQGGDDNMDRGIEFKYFNDGLKAGFFGYSESGIIEGTSTTYYFTYIPDAVNTGNVFTGTVGSAYFKTVKVDDGIHKGIAFYDAYKKLTTTVAAGTSDATTSNQILTVDASGIPVWSTTIDGGTY